MAAIARPDAFDARIVLRLYAWGVIELGLLCAGFGPFWKGLGPTDAWLPVVTRLSGCVMVASGCCAIGLSDGGTRAARRRGLGWFALAHLAMAFGLGIVMRSG